MGTIDSGVQDVLSDSTSTTTWAWMTGPVRTADLQDVKMDLWFAGMGAIKGRGAVQFSDDGVTWTDSEKELFASYVTDDGWSFGSSFSDLFSLSGTTPRTYCRFGLQLLNTTGSDVESAQARIRVHMRPLVAKVVSAGPRKVHSTGSTTTWSFVPLTEGVLGADIEEVRATFEVFCRSSQAKVKVGYQQTDTPDDLTSWGAATEVDGTTLTANDLSYGTSFVTLTPTKSHVRFGAMVQNASTDEIHAALMRLRLEYRRTC